MSFADRTRRPPKTLTDREVARLLKVTGEHKDGFRDHVLFSLALGCGLRESELAALDLGDVRNDQGGAKRVIQLRVFKRASLDADPNDQRVHVPDGTYYKLQKWIKARRAEPDTSPLFQSTRANQTTGRIGGRLSNRRIRELFTEWQRRAGFDVLYNFHTLRHTAITNVRRATGDIRIAQRFARHANIGTTVRYEHASDQELVDAVRHLQS